MSQTSRTGPHSPGDDDDREDRYVKGDTNWENYDLPALIAMVNEKVDIPALVRLADDWRWAGEDVVEAARELGVALDRLMDFWSGRAAERARVDVALNVQWVADLGTTATAVGDPIDEAAGALLAAQQQMPQLPSVAPVVTPGSAPEGAAAAGPAGGPLGEAIGGVAAGTQSAAQAAEQEAALKRQAVETMRRFESVAMEIDQSIPHFEGPSSVLRPNPQPRPRPPVDTGLKVVTDVTLSWQQLTGMVGSSTSAQGFGDYGGGGAGSGGGLGAGAGAAVGAPGPAPVSGRMAGAGSGAGAAPTMERGAGGMPAAAMPVDPDGHHPGMAGAPMGAMGAGAGGATGSDHRRRFPFEEDDPFALDQKASPPVIGL